MSLLKRVTNTSFQYNLFKKGDKIVLGVSGGPDSACLLDVFSQLRKKYSLELIIAHVNYGLRGMDSNKDEEFVRKLAEKYNLPVFVLQPEIKAKNNLENNLRDIRYQFFEKIRVDNEFDYIAVAHNLDDQVETFLMRVIRGAGLQGLSSMKYRTGSVIRPLLSIKREEIMGYLKEKKLSFRIDKTNRESLFLRNKIRNKLIPYLEKNFNPKIKDTVACEIESISEDYSYLQEHIDAYYQENEQLSVKNLRTLPPAIQSRVILKFIGEKKGNLKNIDAAHIREIIKIVNSTKSKSQFVVFQGLKVERKGDKITIEEF